MTDTWPTIQPEDLVQLNEATDQAHHAAQFLALSGKYLVENKADDSNTNMGWMQNAFVGHPLAKHADRLVALEVPSLTLQIQDGQHQVLDEYSLLNKDKAAGFEWLKQALEKAGVDATALNMQLHYDMPEHALQKGALFQALPEASINFCKIRTLGLLVLNHYASDFEHASPIRTWPHHFDIGSYIPIQVNEAGEALTSISLGLAIHDEVIEEHYFYITHWMKAGNANYSKLPDLPSAGYWNRSPWTGAVLKIADIAKIASPSAQREAIGAFMKAGIEASLGLIGG